MIVSTVLGPLLPLVVLFLSVAPSYQQPAIRGSVEDLYAYPRFKVSFLNGYPVENATAQHWLTEGLKGGEDEFMGWLPDKKKKQRGRIEAPHETLHPEPGLKVQQMVLGPNATSYLCLLPSPVKAVTPVTTAVPTTVPGTAATSWQLLEPLNGKCFYLRQGWFTYSYCHNSEVRQFREMAHPHPHPPGGRTPEEDPEYEAYTLGVSPTRTAEQGEVATRQPPANLELRGAGQRYLVQRWGEGSVCDKTGRSREIEIQFHCSMTSTDSILFIKETRTCQYVLILHTPRLCSEPGFRSQRDLEPTHMIRCREIVDRIPQDTDNQIEDAAPGRVGATLGLPQASKVAKIGRNKVKSGGAATKSPETKVGQLKDGDLVDRALSLLYKATAPGGNDQDVEDGEEVVLILAPEDLDLEDGQLAGLVKAFRKKFMKAVGYGLPEAPERQQQEGEQWFEEDEDPAAYELHDKI